MHLRFGLASPEHTTNLNVASCLVVRAPTGEKKDDGSNEMVIRPYTPVSKPDSKCAFHCEKAQFALFKNVHDLSLWVYVRCRIEHVFGFTFELVRAFAHAMLAHTCCTHALELRAGATLT